MTEALLYAVFAQIGLTFALYPLLTWARLRAVGSGVDHYQTYELTDGEDRLAGRIAANLRNQFEAPMVFYVAVGVALFLQLEGRELVILAWTFVAGRIAHASVQILTPNVRLRGLVFVINFAALVGLWGVLAWSVLSGGPTVD